MNIGQIIPIDVVVYNNSTITATNVVTSITLPKGVEFVSTNVFIGSFNSQTLVWTLSSLGANKAQKITLNLKVIDLKYSPFKIKQYVIANEKDINMSNNCKTITLSEPSCNSGCEPGTPSDPKVFINDYTFSPISVNLSSFNNVKCGCCTTKYVIYSVDNFVTNYINSQTGEVRGHALDPFLAWEFTYKVQCLACPDGQQFEFGPKTVSGFAYSTSSSSISLTTPIDTTLNLSGDIHKIRIKSDAIITGFKVGITPGGTEILGPVNTTTAWDTFIVNYFDTAIYSVYFSGITSPSTIIIYSE